MKGIHYTIKWLGGGRGLHYNQIDNNRNNKYINNTLRNHANDTMTTEKEEEKMEREIQ